MHSCSANIHHLLRFLTLMKLMKWERNPSPCACFSSYNPLPSLPTSNPTRHTSLRNSSPSIQKNLLNRPSFLLIHACTCIIVLACMFVNMFVCVRLRWYVASAGVLVHVAVWINESQVSDNKNESKWWWICITTNVHYSSFEIINDRQNSYLVKTKAAANKFSNTTLCLGCRRRRSVRSRHSTSLTEIEGTGHDDKLRNVG